MRVGWLMLTVGPRPRPAEQNSATINELGSKVLMVALGPIEGVPIVVPCSLMKFHRVGGRPSHPDMGYI